MERGLSGLGSGGRGTGSALGLSSRILPAALRVSIPLEGNGSKLGKGVEQNCQNKNSKGEQLGLMNV
eukprot:scaffold294161_cov17-Tisochrysis_lutea.AAC.1